MSYSITQYGKPLDPCLYTIDEEKKIFTSRQDYLVVDFSGLEGRWHVDVDYRCIIKTNHNSTFKTGDNCIFHTGDNCTFDTKNLCIFDTGYRCTFKTLDKCLFNTQNKCTFDTGDNCSLIPWKGNQRYFLDDIYRYILYDDGMLELKNKNDALLNVRHDNEYIREICGKIIKGRDKV